MRLLIASTLTSLAAVLAATAVGVGAAVSWLWAAWGVLAVATIVVAVAGRKA